jgi:hypothetical protein
VTSADRRLDALTTGLTVRERALLALGYWHRDEEPDERLLKYMPPEQKDEFERLLNAVENANGQLYSDSSIWCEWLQQADIEMAWLECLAGLLARQAQLVAALKAVGVTAREETNAARRSRRQAVNLRPMPTPRRGFCRDIPRLCGVIVIEEPSPPDNWEDAVRSLATSVRQELEVRWQELAATEVTLGQLAEAFGADCCHPSLRDVLDALRKKVVDLYQAVLPFTVPFALPEPAERYLENARGRVDWDALKLAADADAVLLSVDKRAWLRQEERIALEEIEAQWKEEARSQKPSPARDVTRDVPALPAGRRRRKEH